MNVNQIKVPAAARALSTLPRADYEDAFVVRLGSTSERTALEWARAILEGAPVATRGRLVSGWSAIGLKLGALRSDRLVLGWSVRESTDDFVLLGADSRIGMPGELLFVRRLRTVLFSTFVQHRSRERSGRRSSRCTCRPCEASSRTRTGGWPSR